jgi:hypothetical protein
MLTRVAKSGNTIAYVLPITHTPPLNDEDGIEIPGATKQRLRLDAERSWIITTELNQFTVEDFEALLPFNTVCGR